GSGERRFASEPKWITQVDSVRLADGWQPARRSQHNGGASIRQRSRWSKSRTNIFQVILSLNARRNNIYRDNCARSIRKHRATNAASSIAHGRALAAAYANSGNDGRGATR